MASALMALDDRLSMSPSLKIQGSMGKEYQAEVTLSLVVEGDLYELTVEGRARCV